MALTTACGSRPPAPARLRAYRPRCTRRYRHAQTYALPAPLAFFRDDQARRASSRWQTVAAWVRFSPPAPCSRDFLGEWLMRKSRLFVLTVGVSLFASVGLLAPSSAAAKPTAVTVNLTAVVDIVDNPNGLTLGDIAPGDVITGSYTYNPQAKDADPSVEAGFYPHTQQPYGIQLDMGSFSVQTDPANVDFQITITNNLNGSDNYQVTSFNNIGTEPGPGVQTISWHLTDPTQSALSNAALKKTPPVLSSWQSSQLDVIGRVDADYVIRSHVTQAVKAA